MKLGKILATMSALALASTLGFTTTGAYAVTGHQDSMTRSPGVSQSDAKISSSGSIQITGSSTALWRMAKDVTFDSRSLSVTQNGVTEKLPTTAVDKNGALVNIMYLQTRSGVEIRAVLMYQDRDIMKCIIGTGGGIILGGGGLALTGAGAGTVIPGVGTVAGAVAGGIIGIVGGGMQGAAASCF